MDVLITGADGFIGRALATRLCEPGISLQGETIRRLTLCDRRFEAIPTDERLNCVAGGMENVSVLAAITETPPDIVFHLASVLSGQSEANYALGLKVNLQATVDLMEALRRQGPAPRRRRPR